MDPFKHFLSTERCSSNESGWTRYLASPMQDDFECSEDNHNKNRSIKDDDVEGNSDDSMVSDASSAPSHHQYKHKNGQGSHGNAAHLKHDKGDYSSKHPSRKEAKKEVKKSAESSGKSKRRLGGQAKYR